MKELDYVEKNMEKLLIGPRCGRQGLLHLVTHLEAMVFVKKSIESGTGGMIQ